MSDLGQTHLWGKWLEKDDTIRWSPCDGDFEHHAVTYCGRNLEKPTPLIATRNNRIRIRKNKPNYISTHGKGGHIINGQLKSYTNQDVTWMHCWGWSPG